MNEAASPPRFPSPEYVALLEGDVEDSFDTDGRPVGEVRASPPVRAAVATTYVECPFSGSRHRVRPMNVSALEQMQRTWPQILGATAVVRELWLERFPAERPDALQLLRLSQVNVLLASYFPVRTGKPLPDQRLPVPVAAIHKINTGLVSACHVMVMQALATRGELPNEPISPKTLYRFVEQQGLLIGPTKTEVCAGPAAMIMEMFELLLDGRTRAAVDRNPILDLLGDDGPGFVSYAAAAIDLTVATLGFGLRMREWVGELTAEVAQGARRGRSRARLLEGLTRFEERGFYARPTLVRMITELPPEALPVVADVITTLGSLPTATPAEIAPDARARLTATLAGALGDAIEPTRLSEYSYDICWPSEATSVPSPRTRRPSAAPSGSLSSSTSSRVGTSRSSTGSPSAI